jgi:ParB family chromosome partitioning protein
VQAEEDSLLSFIVNGGQVPALEVTARDDGGVYIVEGHRRHRAYSRAIAAGNPIEWISIVPFKGNDVEATARILNSNSQLKLTTYEQSLVVKKLSAFNLSPVEIAKLVNMSRSKVDQLLAFTQANHEVQALVRDGDVALHVAVDKVKKHGESAAQELKKDVEKAHAAGKKRVTSSTSLFSATKSRRLVELLVDAEEFTHGDGMALSIVNAAWEEIDRILAEYRAGIK